MFLVTKRVENRELRDKLVTIDFVGEDHLEYVQQFQLMVQRLKEVEADNLNLFNLSLNNLNRFGTRFTASTHSLKNALNSDVAQIQWPLGTAHSIAFKTIS